MSRWLTKTSVRFAIIFLLVIILAAAITWWPARQARQMITQQRALSAQALGQLKQAQNFLDSLPALKAENIRKPGAIKFYSDQAKRVSDQFNKLTLVRPPSLQPIFGISTNGEYKIIKDVNFTLSRIHQQTVYTSSRTDTAVADRLMSYHAAVSAALVNILEYDPAADTQSFNLKSADTQNRLNLARDGLIKTDQRLQAAKNIYKDPAIDEVTAQISGLRYARFQLSNNGDVAAWIKAVDDAQLKIVQNRINFWNQALDPIKSKLANDQQQMSIINGLWQQDAVTYQLS